MRLVVDTNVVVSAVLGGQTSDRVLVAIVRQPAPAWLVSAEIVAEYRAVFARPRLRILQADQQRLWQLIEPTFVVVDPEPLPVIRCVTGPT